MKLQNILITGSSSGIGLETALYLQKNGIKVYASAREQKDVKMLEDLGLKAFKIDVRNKDEISFALNWILKEDKKLDCVFNNAGFAVPGAVEDIKTEILKEGDNPISEIKKEIEKVKDAAQEFNPIENIKKDILKDPEETVAQAEPVVKPQDDPNYEGPVSR